MAEPADRSAQRRRAVGRRGGPRRPRAGEQSQARRPAGVLRQARRGVRRRTAPRPGAKPAPRWRSDRTNRSRTEEPASRGGRTRKPRERPIRPGRAMARTSSRTRPAKTADPPSRVGRLGGELLARAGCLRWRRRASRRTRSSRRSSASIQRRVTRAASRSRAPAASPRRRGRRCRGARRTTGRRSACCRDDAATTSIAAAACASRGRVGPGRFERRQRRRGEQRADPGAEVLRGEVVVGGLAEVVVDVAGLDLVPLAVVVDVLEQPLTRQVTALAHDASRSAGRGTVIWCRCPLLPGKLNRSRRRGRGRAGRAASSARTTRWCVRTRRCRPGSATPRAGGRRSRHLLPGEAASGRCRPRSGAGSREAPRRTRSAGRTSSPPAPRASPGW